MISILIKQLYRSKGLITGLFILIAVGILSIHIGKVFMDRQEKIIELTAQSQADHVQRHVEYIQDDIGLLLYYIRFGFANNPSPLAALSIGQRDMRQAAQLVNIRNLEEQKHTSEFLNPFFQLLGNLDFSFLVIHLFPLIIIALCFNLQSEEKESGRWPLMAIQSGNPEGVILFKLLLRLFIILLTLLILLMVAIPYLSIPLDGTLLVFSAIAVLYVCFWFSLSWWIIGLNKSSEYNAIILLSAWLLLTIVIPTLSNSAVSYLYPIPESYETVIDSRDGYHNKWDLPKEPTIKKFVEHYPQYESYSHPEGASFSWFWYFAMQQMGDDESQDARIAMNKKLNQRNRLTQCIGFFVPSIHTQLSMNALSSTDMTNYLEYMKALESFHEKLRLSFYPEIFETTPVQDIDWSNYKLDYYSDKRDLSPLPLLPLLLINIILLLLASFSSKRNVGL